MKRKIQLNLKRVSPGQTYAILSGLCLIFCMLYLGFFAATMSYASERENARDDIASISTEISEAELALLARSKALTEETARQQGLVLATSKQYVSQTALTYHAPNVQR
jgi:hypothetical protein